MGNFFLGSKWRFRLILMGIGIGVGIFAWKTLPMVDNTPSLVPVPPATSSTVPFVAKRKIAIIGDSITQSGSQRGGYVWLLQEYLKNLYPQQPKEIINAGVSGSKSVDLQQRFEVDVLNPRPDLVMINAGVNDVWHSFKNSGQDTGVPLNRYRESLISMVKAAQSRGITVVLLSPTLIYENLNSPENQRLASYVAAMREIAQEYDCHFVDLNMPFRHVISTYQRYGGQNHNILTRDGIHLNPAGNQMMAYTILKGLGVPEAQIQELKVGN